MQRDRPWRPFASAIIEATSGSLRPTAIGTLVYREVARYIPYDFACFAITDPATGLVTWASKTRSLGVGDEEFAAVEYGPPDINAFAELAHREPPVGVLSVDTDGHPERCRRHRELMAPRFGFTDELRVVFLSRGVAWGVLALYRGPGDEPFTTADAGHFDGATEPVGAAIARSHFCPDPAAEHTDPAEGVQAVLIVDGADAVTQLTASAQAAVEELGGWDCGSLPSGVLSVVASARTRGTQTSAFVHSPTGRWWSLRAAPLSGRTGGGDVVVTVDLTPRAALSRLALAAYGLTRREEDVTLLVLQGASTQSIAGALHLSPHTVQDHLKKIFDKTGVSSRRHLAALLTLD